MMRFRTPSPSTSREDDHDPPEQTSAFPAASTARQNEAGTHDTEWSLQPGSIRAGADHELPSNVEMSPPLA
jgi:hypothetical protein